MQVRIYSEEQWERIGLQVMKTIYKNRKLGISHLEIHRLTGISSKSIYFGFGFCFPFIERCHKNILCWTIKDKDVKTIEKYLKKRKLI